MAVTVTPDGVRDTDVVVPVGDAGREARISFDSGLERVDLRAGDGQGPLLAATFGEPLPLVWAVNHNVHIEYPFGSRMLRRVGPNELRINPTVPWALDVHGGASRLDADLADIDVRSVGLHSGAAHVRLRLGHPIGRCPIRFSSVKDLRIERPAATPVRLEIAKGAVEVSLDDLRYGAVGGGLVAHSQGYDPDAAHYLVTIAGGAQHVTIVEAAVS